MLAIVACLAIRPIHVASEVPSDVPGCDYDIGLNSPEDCPATKADTLVVFSAAWCGPCIAMKPRLIALRAQGYRVIEIDVDKKTTRQELTDSERLALMAFDPEKVPTLVFYNSTTEEQIGERHVGSKITTKQIKARLWKTSSSRDFPQGRFRWYYARQR
jgi:thiol-disulfide isomerase/thioredoxin